MELDQRPNSFFKYRPWHSVLRRQQSGEIEEVNYTEMLLSGREFYCQSPHGFDDTHDSFTGATASGSPYDLDRYLGENMAPIVGVIQELNAKKSKGEKKITSLTELGKIDNPAVNEALSEIAGQRERKDSSALSFSSESNNELMWAFYAEEHRGICLEFDGEHSFFDSIRPVTYSQVPPIAKEHEPIDLAFYKSLAWKHQAEWRLLPDNAFHKFPVELLRRVILGYRFPEAEYQALVQSLISGGYEVEIVQMQRVPNTYEFKALPRARVRIKRS